jgi:hypothetical protein
MSVNIDALTRELISQYDWIFPVVNGERIGHEIDLSSVFTLHGIVGLQIHGTKILEVEVESDSLEARDKLHEKIRAVFHQHPMK